MNSSIPKLVQTIKEVCMEETLTGRLNNFYSKLKGGGSKVGVIYTEGELWKSQRRFTLSNLKTLGQSNRSDWIV